MPDASPDPSAAPDARRPRFALLTTLPLYVLRELAKSVGVALFIYSVVLLAFFAGRIMVKDGVGALTVAQIWPSLFPIISPQVFPFAVITGVLVTYGRLSADREYLAAQAGGVHPLWLALPAGLMATIAVFVVVFLNEFVLAPSANRIEKVVFADQAAILERILGRPGSYTREMPNEILTLSRLPSDARLAGADKAGLEIVTFHPAEPSHKFQKPVVWDPAYPWPTTRIVARHHQLLGVKFNRLTGQWEMSLDFELALYQKFSDGRIIDAQMPVMASGDYTRPVGRGERQSIRQGDPAFMPMTELHTELQRRRAAIERMKDGVAELRTHGAADPAAPSADLRAAEQRLRQATRDANRIASKLHTRIVLAFSCFCFAFLGVPMGLTVQRSGVAATGFIVGVGVAMGYYVVLRMVGKAVDDGTAHWSALWLPTVAVLGLAVFFVRRARRMAM